jgi:hypothetical protein
MVIPDIENTTSATRVSQMGVGSNRCVNEASTTALKIMAGIARQQNQPVRRSRELRGQQTSGSDDDTQNHNAEDGNDGRSHVAHNTGSFSWLT